MKTKENLKLINFDTQKNEFLKSSYFKKINILIVIFK